MSRGDRDDEAFHLKRIMNASNSSRPCHVFHPTSKSIRRRRLSGARAESGPSSLLDFITTSSSVSGLDRSNDVHSADAVTSRFYRTNRSPLWLSLPTSRGSTGVARPSMKQRFLPFAGRTLEMRDILPAAGLVPMLRQRRGGILCAVAGIPGPRPL